MPEKRQFKMHQSLLKHVIKSQAGSLSKAIMELVMNAVDAKATTCDIVIKEKLVTVVDNGQGFGTKKNIVEFFGTFGGERTDSQMADKTYGRFHMGRGQAFAYGLNKWASGKWRMLVDVDNRGLDYELSEVSEDKAGCSVSIELYQPLTNLDLNSIERELGKWLRYVPIAVTCNGRKISRDPAKEEWTEVTDEAYIRINQSSGLTVYNLGIHVTNLGNYTYGTGGEIVSRKPLQVNFARNDVQRSCPVWKKIVKLINAKVTSKNLGVSSLTDGARDRLAQQVLTGELNSDDSKVKSLKLFTAVTGRHFDVRQLSRYSRFSVAPKGDVVGDRVMRSGTAFVFSPETLTRFDVETVDELITKIKDMFSDVWYHEHSVVDIDDIRDTMGETEFIATKDLTVDEKIWLELLSRTTYLIGYETVLREERMARTVIGPWSDCRKLLIGRSDSCDGWTDGSTYVAINREFLKRVRFDVAGFTDVGLLLLHEACHDEVTSDQHDHDQAFYERYHDGSLLSLGKFVKHCVKRLPDVMRAYKKRLSRRDAKAVDACNKLIAADVPEHAVTARSKVVNGT